MFYLFDINIVDLMAFCFLQGKMPAPEKSVAFQSFCAPKQTQLASGAHFVQACNDNIIMALFILGLKKLLEIIYNNWTIKVMLKYCTEMLKTKRKYTENLKPFLCNESTPSILLPFILTKLEACSEACQTSKVDLFAITVFSSSSRGVFLWVLRKF